MPIVFSHIKATMPNVTLPFQYCMFVGVSVCLFANWLRGTAVERWSLSGELSLSCARPAADGRVTTYVSAVGQPTRSTQPLQEYRQPCFLMCRDAYTVDLSSVNSY